MVIYLNFYIITNEIKDIAYSATSAVVEYLIKKRAGICTEHKHAPFLDKYSDIKFLNESECISFADAAIVIGGDGTILKAAHSLYGSDIPIIGINLGKVGYMAELEINECFLMDCLFDETQNSQTFHTDERMMLECNVIRNEKTVYTGVCLNEAVVAKGDITRVIDLELIHGGNTIAYYQGDGIIVSTPTGSTAYAMSAGGAVIDPEIECISVIPLCPYLCINSSPIIFSKKTSVTLRYRCSRQNTAYLSIDGGEGFKLSDGDKVCISAAKHSTKLARFKNTDFYKLLNTKITHRASELAERT